MPAVKKATVMLVDDHQIMRHGLKYALETEGYQVVAEAGEGLSACELALQKCPKVIVMDVTMPDLNGIEATKRILAANPETRIIGLSMHTDPVYVIGMLNAGAAGFLLKTSSFSEVLGAIDAAVKGQSYLCPEITNIVVENALNPIPRSFSSPLDQLTNRDHEILQMIAEGKRNPDIAKILKISTRTVENHRFNLMKKLDIHSVAELTKFAIREGITSLN